MTNPQISPTSCCGRLYRPAVRAATLTRRLDALATKVGGIVGLANIRPAYGREAEPADDLVRSCRQPN